MFVLVRNRRRNRPPPASQRSEPQAAKRARNAASFPHSTTEPDAATAPWTVREKRLRRTEEQGRRDSPWNPTATRRAIAPEQPTRQCEELAASASHQSTRL